MKKALTIFTLLLITYLRGANAQTFPVQVTTQLAPPYSVHLADYVASGTDRLAVNIFLRDINRLELRVKLRVKIEGQGITLQTKPSYLPPALIIQGGLPERLISSDLVDYFNPDNLDFVGITKRQFLQTGALPEGVYRFSIEVLEYNRGVKISNSGTSIAWLILNDPPIINIPHEAEKVKAQFPQNVIFQWTPRHTGSPNSAFSTEYEFRMVEIWPKGRNPNDAIRTSHTFFETTTQSTSLIYGIAEPALIPGRSYAFQVRAKSIVGIDELDLFKNNGYSQVHTFTFGDACLAPTELTVEDVTSTKIKLSWEVAFNHTGYTVSYREANDPDAEWFQEETFFTDHTITSLKEDTEYEFQVLSACGTLPGEETESQKAATDVPVAADLQCGLPPEAYSFDNNAPLASLLVSDQIFAGDFDVKVTKVEGSNGTFSGEGIIVVPLLNNIKVKVEFESITINEEYLMTAGHMQIIGGALDVLPDEVTDSLDELDEILSSVDNVLDDVSAGLDLADPIIGEVGDLANDILDNGPFTTEEEKDLDGSTVEEYLEAAKAAVEEAAGALAGNVSIESTGKAARKVAQGIALKKRANRLQDIYDQSDTLQIIAVEFYDSDKYGFDQQLYEQHRLHYDIIVTPDNESHGISWVATKSGEQETVTARLVPSAGIPADSIIFKTGDTELSTDKKGSGEWDITLPSLEKDQTLTVIAINKATSATVGKLDAIGYEPITKKVNVVPVGNISFSLSGAEIQTQLNQIYQQAVASWEVQVLNPLAVTGYTGTLQDDEQALLSVYSEGMREIIKAFEARGTMNKDEFYLFIVDKSQSGKAGYMPRKHRYGFIYTDNNNNIPRTIAHELGHGAFRLQHTFEEYPTIDSQTANLMDYGSGTKLRKYQWDLIHNPPIVIGLLEDDQESAYTVYDSDKIRNILEIFRCAYINQDDVQYDIDEAGLIAHNITLADGIEYDFLSIESDYSISSFEFDPSSSPEIISNTDRKFYKYESANGGYLKIRVNEDQTDAFFKFLKPSFESWSSQMSSTFASIKQNITQDPSKAKDDLYMLAGCGLNKLPIDIKFDLVQTITTEFIVDAEDEELILKVLQSIEQENDAQVFIQNLSDDKTGLLKELDKSIDGSNYRLYHSLLAKIFFISKTSTIQNEIETLENTRVNLGVATLEQFSNNNVFYWLNPGFIKRFTESNYGYLDYSDFSYKDSGELNFDIENIALVFSYSKFSVETDPFELVRVQLLTSSKDLEQGSAKGHYYLPAINIALLINEQSWDEFNQALNSAFAIGTFGSGILAQGGKTAVIEGFFAALSAASLVIDDYRYELSVNPEGQEFLKKWEIFNAALAIWQISKVAVALPQGYKSLKTAYTNLKVKHPEKAGKIADDVDDIFKQAEEAIDDLKITNGSGIEDLPEALSSARSRVRAAYGDEYVDLTLRQKFGSDQGAAAVVIDKYGVAGKRILDDVNIKNLDDAAKAIVKDKDIMRFYDQHMYRAVNETSYNFGKMKSTGIIDASPTQFPTYVSLDDFTDATKAKNILQLPKKPTWVAEFTTDQVVKDVRFAKGKFNQADYTEVLTHAYPNWGKGGGTQFLTNAEIKVSKLKNLVTGEVIDFNAIRKTLANLKSNTNFKKHLFNGEIKKTVRQGATQPTFSVSGVHHKSAVDNVKVRISNKSAPDANGVYTAKVEMYHEDLKPINGTGWKKKGKNSTFFPDDWDQDKVLMEISHAFENKKLRPNSTNKYYGFSSEGVEIEFFVKNGAIDTAYPILN